ncbi:MAG: T9SS type A sorting domain-containing protein [Flavobacteriaceae bacterium]
MKRALLIVTTFVFFTTANGQILNGSFENDSTADLSGWEWRCYENQSSNTSPIEGGNWSLKVPGGSLQGCHPNYAYQKLPTITHGQAFLLTGWVHGDVGLTFGKINSGIITIQSGSTTSSETWTKLGHLAAFSLSDGDTAIVLLTVPTMGGVGSFTGYFDLINLEQVSDLNTLKNEITLKLFPNPFNIYTTLYSDKGFVNTTLTLTNTLGQIVKQKEKLNGKRIILQRENLMNGMYYIHLSEKNKIIATEKIIITD